MKTGRILILILLIAAAFLGGLGYGRWYAKGPAASQAQNKGERKILYWVDPMHPAYKSDKPGIAPDCGMKLEPVYADGGPAGETAERKILHYSDPQQPSYTSETPGLNPETGNELEPVYAGDVPGTVQISPEKQQLIGVQYGEVQYTESRDSVRAVGKIAPDETRVGHVHSRTDGWIEQVFVGATGEAVKKGQPLLTIYSPELLAAQQEFLLALKSKDIMKHSTMPGALRDTDSLVDASRRRLQLWNLSAAQIEKLEKTQEPVKAVTLESPVSGVVMTRNAFPSQRVMPDTDLYTVVDLKRVWVQASVFEADAARVRVGQAATVELPYEPGKSYRAQVTFIQPQVDPATRTLQVRLELDNPGGKLKPDMFVNVDLGVSARRHLTLPAEAVLDAGLTKTVFLDRGNGFFEPRQVETGERIGDRIEILGGLKPGERVVTSGNFLISSESQLKTAGSGAGAGGHQHSATTGTEPQPAPPAAPAAPAKMPEGHQHD